MIIFKILHILLKVPFLFQFILGKRKIVAGGSIYDRCIANKHYLVDLHPNIEHSLRGTEAFVFHTHASLDFYGRNDNFVKHPSFQSNRRLIHYTFVAQTGIELIPQPLEFHYMEKPIKVTYMLFLLF